MGRRAKGEDYEARAVWLLDKLGQMKLNKTATVVEIGVWKADFSETVFFRRGNLPILWVGVNPFEYYPEKHDKAKSQEAWDRIYDRVKTKTSKWWGIYELIRDTSSGALPKVQSLEGIDLLFIDGDHSNAAVKEDLRLYSSLVRVGGIVSGHDYQLESVRQAVDEYSRIGKREPTIEQFREGRVFWWKQTKTSRKLAEKACSEN